MALEYDFEILTDKTDEALAKTAAEVHGVDATPDHWGFSAPGLGVTVVKAAYSVHQNVVERERQRYKEGYGFVPNLDVSITQVRSIGYELSLENIGKSVAALFQQTHEKAIFLFNYDLTIAQRLEEGGIVEVTVEPREDGIDVYRWLTDALEAAGVKYVRRELPSPLQL